MHNGINSCHTRAAKRSGKKKCFGCCRPVQINPTYIGKQCSVLKIESTFLLIYAVAHKSHKNKLHPAIWSNHWQKCAWIVIFFMFAVYRIRTCPVASPEKFKFSENYSRFSIHNEMMPPPGNALGPWVIDAKIEQCCSRFCSALELRGK